MAANDFGWLKDISTKELINRKFFATQSNDLVMVKVLSAEIDKRLEHKLTEIQLKAAYLMP